MLSSIGLSRFSGRGSEDIGNPTSELDSTRPDGGAAAKKKAAAKSQKNKAWNQMNRNVEKVVDTIGETISEEFYEFLETYRDPDTGSSLYIEMVKELSHHQATTLYVDFDHVQTFSSETANAILLEYYRLEPYLKKAVRALVKKHNPEHFYQSNNPSAHEANAKLDDNAPGREFAISWYGIPDILKLRELRTHMMGRLVSFSGTVTRTSEIRPELTYGTFKCMDCGTMVKDVQQDFAYTEPPSCPNPTCMNRIAWHLDVSRSKFSDWQKVRVQENSGEVPSGSMPRTIEVVLRNDIVDRCKPGDKILFTGIPIAVPDVSQLGFGGANAQLSRQEMRGRPESSLTDSGVTGLSGLGVRDLTYKLCFLGLGARPAELRSTLTSLNDMLDEEIDPEVLAQSFTATERDEIIEMSSDRNVMRKLVESVAPHISGHNAIKEGLLLQLLGGVHKVTPEGIRLRGDINVCIVGDPSTAKSQFLKYVVNMMPRAVYTSGKASSAAGLTASVIKDEETGEFTIEAGALMLADNGICCIDEFDKMDLKDQVAIHEAMEQQTISIAKAGIHATLNARTSILAAANPIYGRYDTKMTLRQNIAMSPPIMSRFDLFFVVLDKCDETTDYAVARHIVDFHMQRDEAIVPHYSQEQILRYLKYARGLRPQLTDEAKKLMVKMYQEMRSRDAVSTTKVSQRMTVRQLESMIRLSEALAKMHCDAEISPRYVQRAKKLLEDSIVGVDSDAIDLEDDEDMSQRASIVRPADYETRMDVDDEAPHVRASAVPASGALGAAGAAPERQKLAIDYEKYRKISNAIVTKLREIEESGKEEGMKMSQTIDWYLETIEDELDSEDQLEQERRIVSLVIKRLYQKDHVLIRLRQTDDLSGDPAQEESQDDEDPTLVVHPNYVPEF